MAKLAFIRNSTCADCWDYFECKTDVWIFGDVEGYDFFRQEILKAIKVTENVHLTLLEQHSTSMRCVILPAKKDDTRKPRLKFIERFISDSSGPNMELVIFGNQSGYRYLAESIARLAKKSIDGPSEHIHLDDLSDSCVVPRSVSLNLRGPICKWERKSLGEYAELVYSKNQNYLPSVIDYRLNQKDEYEEISVKESEFLKL